MTQICNRMLNFMLADGTSKVRDLEPATESYKHLLIHK